VGTTTSSLQTWIGAGSTVPACRPGNTTHDTQGREKGSTSEQICRIVYNVRKRSKIVPPPPKCPNKGPENNPKTYPLKVVFFFVSSAAGNSVDVTGNPVWACDRKSAGCDWKSAGCDRESGKCFWRVFGEYNTKVNKIE